MATQDKEFSRQRSREWTRLLLLVLLLAAESFFVSLRFDAWVLIDADGPVWYRWLGASGHLVKIAIVFLVAFGLAIAPRLTSYLSSLIGANSGRPYRYLVLLQIVAFGLFFAVTQLIFTDFAPAGVAGVVLPVVWLALAVCLVVLWGLAVAPIRFWNHIVRSEYRAIGVATSVALVSWSIALASQQLWGVLAEWTYQSSAYLLGNAYSEIVVDATNRVLGTPEFFVNIAPACSGYEGIGLVVVFLSFYLSTFRSDFKFPAALFLFPIGISTIWAFNVIRIVALIAIGTEWSPQVALGGFHSQAGWISFVVVTVALLMAAHRIPAFAVQSGDGRADVRVSSNMALIIPLIALLTMTLVTMALSADVDWFYPLRVIVTGGVLIILWRHYATIKFRVSIPAVLTGVLVFLIWIAMVAPDPVADGVQVAQLQQASGWVLLAWLVFRTIGSAITVPLAEELAFRGYLVGRLSGASDILATPLRFAWVPFLISSLAFGLLHSAWIAGIIAGLAYGLIRYYRDNLSDAVVAHSVTNLLLSVYVILTGKLSIW